MSDEREVECQDCGYRWKSSADRPRCSQPDCGRSRNVEPVADAPIEDDDEQDDDAGQQTPQQTPDDEDDPADSTDEESAEDASSGYTPAFSVRQERTDTQKREVDTTETSTDADRDDGEDAEAGDKELADDETPAPEADAEIPELDPATLKPAMEGTFNVVALNRGDHWELDDKEAEQLAEAWTPVINHYAPVVFREHALIAAACMTSYSVLAPRLAKDQQLAADDDLEAERERDTEAGEVREQRTDLDLDQPADEADEQDETETEAPGGYAAV
jgi:hypothetical protein